MKRCLFTYKPLSKGEENYSSVGLKLLSRNLIHLKVFSYNQAEQIQIAQKMVGKISIQGIQPKFSVVLSETQQTFTEIEKNGKYILKPQVKEYERLPENEDLTMHLVAMTGLKVPWHGLIKCSDESHSYVIKRFDRSGKEKISTEDFSQLIGASRVTKYDVTIEKVAEAISLYCTFPTLEWFKLYQIVLLAFLLGNEDLHLKNLSVMTSKDKIELSPVYDFINTTIAMASPEEEMALSICDKKKNFTKKDFIEGFAIPTLFLPRAKVEKELQKILKLIPLWKEKIETSFLSPQQKKKYLDLLSERAKRLA